MKLNCSIGKRFPIVGAVYSVSGMPGARATVIKILGYALVVFQGDAGRHSGYPVAIEKLYPLQ